MSGRYAGQALRCAAACLLLAAFGAVHAAGCRDALPGAQTIGAGQFCVLGFCLYDAQLVATEPPLSWDVPFALSLTYRRHLSGARIVEAGVAEMRRLGGDALPAATLDTWRSEMRGAIGDVEAGDTLCGLFLPGRGARFYANDKPTAEIADPAFARAFFGIWLDPRTRAKALRDALLGGHGGAQ